jgi:hypothetical protein
MNPQQLYFIHRKGWSKENATVESVNVVDSLIHCGLEYIFINTCEGTVHDLPYTIIHEEQCVRIYKLQNDGECSIKCVTFFNSICKVNINLI